MIHSFTANLSASQTREGALDNIYKAYFKNVSGVNRIRRVDDMGQQRAGIDSIVTLNSGVTLKTQEKWRFRPFTNDFLIEYCSVYQNGECKSPGWIYSIDADYIFTVYEPSELVKVYPVIQLKIAWSNKKNEWFEACRHINAYNDTYVTKSVIVPTSTLEDELLKTMRFDFQQELNWVTA